MAGCRMAERRTTDALDIRDLGLVKYREVLALQQQLNRQRQADEIGDVVLIVEHPPVVTLGARQSANKLLVEDAELAKRGIDVVPIRRGGGTTAHNPGQLVFYPILNLQRLGLGISEYIRTLEAIGIELLASVDVTCDRRKGFPGLWVDERKIASIGVRVSRSVTYHGMAINVCNDLSIFDAMVPCGLDGVAMTSAEKETTRPCDMREIKEQLVLRLRQYFGSSRR